MPGVEALDLATARPSTFEPLLGSRFDATLPDARGADLELIEVARPRTGADERPFSLTFLGGPTPPVGQGMVRLAHEAAGTLDLFMVPAAPDAAGPCYVAVLA